MRIAELQGMRDWKETLDGYLPSLTSCGNESRAGDSSSLEWEPIVGSAAYEIRTKCDGWYRSADLTF